MPARALSPALSEQGFDISGSLVTGGDYDTEKSSWIQDHQGEKTDSKLSGLDDDLSEDDDQDDEAFIQAQQAASNRKASNLKGRTVKKGGGFQSMGLSSNVLKCITKKGFAVPTPIQRKTIPLILDRQDVVGMARTGSGKTAAFVIPMIERLKAHSVRIGARAIVLSPSRELALQTLKTVKEFGRGTDLRTILLVGGDNLEGQFAEMSSNPDIIIATPGRFLHLLVEMSLDLSSVQYAVFDEADRLFEMGFATQLTEILYALPPARQTLLFSATLPTSLVEFAKAGLKDPQLVRLDAESKISPDLQSAFLSVKSSDKDGALLHLLSDVIKMPTRDDNDPQERSAKEQRKLKRKRESSKPNQFDLPSEYSTIVFAATKHHVEYLTQLLRTAGYPVSHVYGSLDQLARKDQVQAFREGKTTILVVTDVAARGIDIPLLANVINYDFPPQAKVFVHRVGRTARAGRSGWSYSLVQDSDIPYLLDLQLFLGRSLVVGSDAADANLSADIVLGTIPNAQLERNCETVVKLLEKDDIENLRVVALKGEKLYKRTRTGASTESVKRAKAVAQNKYLQTANQLYAGQADALQDEKDSMLARISGFRPAATIFELGNGTSGGPTEAMRRTKLKIQAAKAPGTSKVAPTESVAVGDDRAEDNSLDEDDENDVVIAQENSDDDDSDDIGHSSTAEPSQSWQDSDHFMSYEPRATNLSEERGYGVNSGSTFAETAKRATMSLTNDESRSFAEPSKMRWDKKSKKYVSRANDEDGSRGAKTVRGESGQKIAASFRSGRFDTWKRAQRMGRLPRTGEVETAQTTSFSDRGKRYRYTGEESAKAPDKYRDDYHSKKRRLDERKQTQSAITSGQAKSELRDANAVRKQRDLKQKRHDKNARPSKKRRKT